MERAEGTAAGEPPADFGAGPPSAAASGPGARSFCRPASRLCLLPPVCPGRGADPATATLQPRPPSSPRPQGGPGRTALLPARTTGVGRRTPTSCDGLSRSCPVHVLLQEEGSRRQVHGGQRPRGHTWATEGGPAPLPVAPWGGGPRFRPGVPGGSTLGFNVRAVLGAGWPVTLPVSSRCCGTTSLRVP